MELSLVSEIQCLILLLKFPHPFLKGNFLSLIRIIKIFFIFRYNLKPNDAILATDEHKGLNESLLRDYPNHQFIAGGATQNTMRAATVNISIRASNRSNFALTIT
jgi:hypothetical protein